MKNIYPMIVSAWSFFGSGAFLLGHCGWQCSQKGLEAISLTLRSGRYKAMISIRYRYQKVISISNRYWSDL